MLNLFTRTFSLKGEVSHLNKFIILYIQEVKKSLIPTQKTLYIRDNISTYNISATK